MFLKAGTLLDGRYLVGRVLGHGGFGVTYLGVDVRLGLRVAIKEHLPRELAVRDTDGVSVSIFSGDAADAFRYGLGKFLEEGKALAKFVEHPNIVSVVSFFEENGTGYLVMRYVEGMSLEELRKERGGRLPESETVSLMMAALDGLRAVHKAGMLHRDIKPQNIYYAGETGQVKLLDFGAAREAVSGKSGGLTQLWTPGYAPVEQCHSGGKQGPWTDIYAVGATMYALLAGETPPDSMDRKLGSTKMKSPGAVLGVNISKKVSSVVMKAMSVESGDRYQNVEEMQRDLMVRAEGNKDWGAGISDSRSESRSGTGFSGGAPAKGGSKASVNVAKPVEAGIIDLDCGGGVMLKLKKIPAGSFMMGGDKFDAEKPIHKVTFAKPFYMGVYPVTQEQYKAVMGLNPSYFKNSKLSMFWGDMLGKAPIDYSCHPVDNVTWNDAKEFCRKLSRKTGVRLSLPSEAQWEYACRAGTRTEYYFGNDKEKLKQYANWKGTPVYGGKSTSPVGMFLPNDWGLYDMHGNVYEWCEDKWHENYKGAPFDGSVWISEGLVSHVLRGGSWGSFFAGWLRAAYRYGLLPTYRGDGIGFRCACGPVF